MDIVTKDEVNLKSHRFFKLIMGGKLFIHPTDTIYGLGCDATSDQAVKNLRAVKSRYKRPFSVIAPSKDWILENCSLNGHAKKWLDKLPGPYTLIFRLKNDNVISEQTTLASGTLGVRIPDHWFSSFVEKLGIPVVTTSANLTGEDFMTAIEDLNPAIKAKTAFCIYEGPKKGKPSTVVDLTSEHEKILRA